MQIAGKVAVITGASSGIGRSLAVELGLRGARVVISARSAAKLQESAWLLGAYGIEYLQMPLDVTSESSIDDLLERVRSTWGGIDIFVNNAGIGLFETIAASKAEDIETVFKTNLWGPLMLMQKVAPLIQGGTLVNISSAAAKYAPSRQGIYAASKAAMDRVTEAFALEEESHMKTLLVVPDRTDTPFMQHVVGSRETARLGLKLRLATPEAVARLIVHAIEKDRSVCYTTPKSRIYSILSALFPGLVKSIIRKTVS